MPRFKGRACALTDPSRPQGKRKSSRSYNPQRATASDSDAECGLGRPSAAQSSDGARHEDEFPERRAFDWTPELGRGMVSGMVQRTSQKCVIAGPTEYLNIRGSRSY